VTALRTQQASRSDAALLKPRILRAQPGQFCALGLALAGLVGLVAFALGAAASSGGPADGPRSLTHRLRFRALARPCASVPRRSCGRDSSTERRLEDPGR